MDAASRKSGPPEKTEDTLPGITYRQLVVFSLVCREKSYANAAVERRTTRASIKRVMKDFEEAVGRPLFIEQPGKDLELTPFGQGLLSQVTPLARSLRRLGDSIRTLHQAGRILRVAAPPDFFRGGMFSGILEKLHLADGFRLCFLKIESKRFRTALLNAECDVYFGIGLEEPERLDCIDFGPVPWTVIRHPQDMGKAAEPIAAVLAAGRWSLGEAGEEGSPQLLKAFHSRGATGGVSVPESLWRERLARPQEMPRGEVLLAPDTEGASAEGLPPDYPAYRFTAVMRRNHPYSELQSRLQAVADQSGKEGAADGH